MENRKVVTSKRRARRARFEGFNFTRDHIPAGDGVDLLTDYRARAWQAFEELPYPTTKDEAWRRTDIRRLNNDFQLPRSGVYEDLAPVPERLLKPLVSEQHGGQIILLPGGLEHNVDPSLAEEGVIFTDLETAAREYPDQLSRVMGQIVKPSDGKFAALTGALTRNGIFVYVPRGVQVEQPLHSLMWAAGSGLAHFSHLLVWLEEGASLTYVHEAASPNGVEGQTLHGGIVEIYVGTHANLRFVELQSLGDNVWNFAHERVSVERDGNLDWVFGAIGTKLTKNFSDLDLVGRGASGRMSGFILQMVLNISTTIPSKTTWPPTRPAICSSKEH